MSWDELLKALVATVRERKSREAEEKDLKEQVLLAYKLTQPDSNIFRVDDARVQVKQRTDLKIHKPEELIAVMGPRGSETLKPNAKLVWGVLSKVPSLMARAMASGTISVVANTYVEVNLGGETEEALEALEAKRGLADEQPPTSSRPTTVN